jgi:hypothetical protein
MTPDRNLQKRNLTFVPALAIAVVMALPPSASGTARDCAPRGSQPLELVTIEKNREGAWMQPALLLIGSEAEWNSRMDEMTARNELFMLPAPSAPQADWNTEMVVLVSLGSCPTTGYDIEITGVTRSGRRAILTVEVTTPVSDINSQTLTMPYHLVKIARNGLNSVEICYGSIEASADPQAVWPGLATIAVSSDAAPLTANVTWGTVKSLIR